MKPLTFLLILLLAAPVALSQDGDGVGSLPKAGGKHGGGSTPMESNASNTVAIATVFGVHEAELDLEMANVRVDTLEGTPVDLDEDADPDEAMIEAIGPAALPVILDDPGVVVQGGAWVEVPAGLEVVMHAPAEAELRNVVLLVHAYEPGETVDSLDAVLDGSAQADAFVVAGDIASIDLELFGRKVAKFSELTDTYVTWAFVSVSDGDVHVSGVRASTAGGRLEIAID